MVGLREGGKEGGGGGSFRSEIAASLRRFCLGTLVALLNGPCYGVLCLNDFLVPLLVQNMLLQKPE